jgi:hypothetical protein
MDFTNRIKKKYPGCDLLAPKINPSPEEHLSSPKQFLQISKVTPAAPGTYTLFIHFLIFFFFFLIFFFFFFFMIFFFFFFFFMIFSFSSSFS